MTVPHPPHIGETITATGQVRTVELRHQDGPLRVTLDVDQLVDQLVDAPVHTCGRGCVACAAHDPRDRRDHGHLPADMCDACRAELTPQGYPDDDIVAAAGLEGMARGRDRVSWEDVARAALEEIAKRDALEARRRAHEAATIVHSRQADAAPLESRPGPSVDPHVPSYVGR